MKSYQTKNVLLKILLLCLFFGLLSLVVEIAFFNKDYFYHPQIGSKPSLLANLDFDYFWIRHLALFLGLIIFFIAQRKKINFQNLKPYAALFLLLLNIIPGISFLSKYFFLFLIVMLFLYLKSNNNFLEYRKLLRSNIYIIVLFLVLFILFFPLFLKEGYVYDPLAPFMNSPGYRLARPAGLEKSAVGASDLFDAFLPQWRFTYQSIRRGIFPLWQYQKGLGAPLYQQSYHPEKLISFLLRPSEALTLIVLLKLFLSTMGMYYLLHLLNIRNIISAIGGLAYAFSGFIIGWLFGPQSSPAYHLPFLFLFLIKYLKNKEAKYLFYFALWTALAIYSGFIAVAGYFLYALGFFLILFYLFHRSRLSLKIRELLKISLYWLLGIVSVSFLFIPLYYKFFIEKTIDISYRNIGNIGFLSPKYFINIIFPFYYGWKITPEVRPYISSVVIFFLILGVILFFSRLLSYGSRVLAKEKYYFLFLLVLIPFLMAMFGRFPFYQLSCRLPLLNSSPLSRLQSVTCFLLVILGVMGLEMFVQSYSRILRLYRKKKFIFLAVIEILLGGVLLVAVTSVTAEKAGRYHTVYPVFFLLAAVILTFQLSVIFRKKSHFFLIPLLFLVSVEAVVQNYHYIAVNKKSKFITKIEPSILKFIKGKARPYDGLLVFDANFNTNGTLGNYGLREKIVHQFYAHDHKALVVETFSKRSFASPTAPILNSGHTDFSSSFIQLLGVKYLIFRSGFQATNLPSYYNLVYSNLDGRVYENKLYKKNFGIFFGKPLYYKPEEKKEIIKSVKSMDYTKNVYLAENNELNLKNDSDMSFSITTLDYTPNKIVYRYRANSEGVITFPEAYDDGWSVTVRGQRAQVLQTNLIFRGVAVKKGEGLIIFEYHISKLYKISVLVGLISLTFLMCLFFFYDKVKRTKKIADRKNLQ